jgi:hypothetical protein
MRAVNPAGLNGYYKLHTFRLTIAIIVENVTITVNGIAAHAPITGINTIVMSTRTMQKRGPQ